MGRRHHKGSMEPAELFQNLVSLTRRRPLRKVKLRYRTKIGCHGKDVNMMKNSVFFGYSAFLLASLFCGLLIPFAEARAQKGQEDGQLPATDTSSRKSGTTGTELPPEPPAIKVDVAPLASDPQIAKRLNDIFNATN